jgi:hypothetical protein
LDPVVALNLLFDVIIILLAIYAYSRKKNILPLWLTLGFCFFALSYVMTILGITSSLILLPLRAIGYLSIIAGLALQIQKR